MLSSQEKEEIMGLLQSKEFQPSEVTEPTYAIVELPRSRQWPKPLAEQAFHGIAGEIIRLSSRTRRLILPRYCVSFSLDLGISSAADLIRLLTALDMDATCSSQS